MYHFIYKTTNLSNNKFYVGKHSTYNLNDGYYGSGPAIVESVRQHGINNFKTDILFFCPTEEEVIKLESKLVTRDFVLRDDTYNINKANQGYTWTGIKRPEQADVMRKAEPWKYKRPQVGELNPAFGKPAHNRKPLKAEKDGYVILANSIQQLASKLGIGRAAIRANVEKRSINRDGWTINYV